MSQESYAALLKDPRWLERRAKILDRDEYCCRGCGHTDVDHLECDAEAINDVILRVYEATEGSIHRMKRAIRMVTAVGGDRVDCLEVAGILDQHLDPRTAEYLCQIIMENALRRAKEGAPVELKYVIRQLMRDIKQRADDFNSERNPSRTTEAKR